MHHLKLISLTIYFLSFTVNAQFLNVGAGELFTSSTTNYERYELILGEMIFQSKDDENYTKGYRPAESVFIGGQLTKRVFDYPRDVSPISIVDSIKSSLSLQNYEFLYDCFGYDCGGLPGWSLYLSEHVGGKIDDQFYVVAKSKYKSERRKKYVVFHVSKIDQQSRLILHEIEGSASEFRYPTYASSLFESDANLALLHEFYFDSGSATEATSQNIEALIDEVRKLGIGEEVLLVGFTDPVGDRSRNIELAEKRAWTIKELMINGYGVDGNSISLLAGGELEPSGGNKNNHLLRKVSVYKFSMN